LSAIGKGCRCNGKLVTICDKISQQLMRPTQSLLASKITKILSNRSLFWSITILSLLCILNSDIWSTIIFSSSVVNTLFAELVISYILTSAYQNNFSESFCPAHRFLLHVLYTALFSAALIWAAFFNVSSVSKLNWLVLGVYLHESLYMYQLQHRTGKVANVPQHHIICTLTVVSCFVYIATKLVLTTKTIYAVTT